MSVNLYSPLLRKDHVDTRLEQIGELINKGLVAYAAPSDESDAELERRIEILQEQENHFFEMLNIPTNIDVNTRFAILNDRVQSCDLRLSNLNGSMIQEEILDICSAAYHERLLKFLQEEISKGNFGEELKQALQSDGWKNAFINYLNENVATKTGQKGRLKTKTKGLQGFSGNFKDLTAKELTSTAKERIEALVTEYTKNLRSDKPVYDYIIDKSSVKVEAMDWTGVIKGLTVNQAKRLLDDGQLQEINNKIKELIEKYAQAPDNGVLNQVLDLVIRTNKYAFFVGKNLKAITGLLGEIQGVYYLSVLTNTSPSLWYPSDGPGEFAKMQWVADIRRGKLSQKASIDILLDNVGIQVKNTTREMTDEFYNVVEFVHGISLDELAKALDIQDSAFMDAISSLYQTYGFNIEYQRKDGSYVAEDNEEFAPTREQMEVLLSLAERLFGVWLECAMHMGANKSFETALETNANSIYFINGLFYSSSEILIMLYDALRKGTKSGARVRASMPKKDYNIVTYMNNKDRRSSMYGQDKAIRDIDLKVSMAFDFGSLL